MSAMNDFSTRITSLSPAKLELLSQRLKTKAAASSQETTISRSGHDASPAPLSYSQQRLWFLDQLEPGGTAYNQLFAVRLEGDLDVEALARTLTEVARRHEILRTTYALIDGEPAQLVSPPAPVPLPLTDLSALPEAARPQALRSLLREEAQTPFDLATGPVLRARLIRLSGREHVAAL
jgi:Condensation domain